MSKKSLQPFYFQNNCDQLGYQIPVPTNFKKAFGKSRQRFKILRKPKKGQFSAISALRTRTKKPKGALVRKHSHLKIPKARSRTDQQLARIRKHKSRFRGLQDLIKRVFNAGI